MEKNKNDRLNVAIIQICSSLDWKLNIDKISGLIGSAKADCPELDGVFLPEVFYSMSDGTGPTPFLVAENNEHYENIRNLALKHQLYILGGSAATKRKNEVYNRAYNFSPVGEDLGHYDKKHLFALSLKGEDKANLDESRVYSAGSEGKMIELGEFKIGISICFDLRFPELFRDYFTKGANVLTVASAFTKPTGKAHWETLLRARAIENQSYVIAANQWGKHNEKISTYGHSMIIDPWGEIIAEIKEGESYAIAELKLKRIEQVRQRMDISVR